MCTSIQPQSCGCTETCGCMVPFSVEDEIKMLESEKQRTQVRLDMIERRLTGLKKAV